MAAVLRCGCSLTSLTEVSQRSVTSISDIDTGSMASATLAAATAAVEPPPPPPPPPPIETSLLPFASDGFGMGRLKICTVSLLLEQHNTVGGVLNDRLEIAAGLSKRRVNRGVPTQATALHSTTESDGRKRAGGGEGGG